MTRINLLPWRDELRQEKKKAFLSFLLMICLLTGLAGYVWVLHVDSKIETQQNRNGLLKNGIKALDAELKEIKTLKRRREEWIARMGVIQALQGNRTEIVKVFDDFVRVIPDGIYISNMRFKSSLISLVGFAESNNRISALMRNLDDSNQFRDSNLNKIGANKALGEQGYRFELKVRLKKPKSLSEQSNSKG